MVDDHHAGGRRETANEHEQRQRVLAGRQRQRQHEILGVHGAGAEVQQPAQRNWQHEQVDQEQVKREYPDGAAQVTLAHIFDHHDLELPR
jgi:hypothetical protein